MNEARTANTRVVEVSDRSRRASDRHARKMTTTTSDELDSQGQLNAGLALDEHLWRGTRGATRPGGPRLEAGPSTGGTTSEIDFIRRAGYGARTLLAAKTIQPVLFSREVYQTYQSGAGTFDAYNRGDTFGVVVNGASTLLGGLGAVSSARQTYGILREVAADTRVLSRLNPLNYRVAEGLGANGANIRLRYVGPDKLGYRNARNAPLYEVGLAKDLRANPSHGVATDTIAEHVPQTKWARDLVGDFSEVNNVGHEPAIRLSQAEADAITRAETLTQVPVSAREALAIKIQLLRQYTNAPNSALLDLIELNKQLHYYDYVRLR